MADPAFMRIRLNIVRRRRLLPVFQRYLVAKDYFESVRLRALELKAEGLEFSHAFGRAHLESLLKQRPSAWGDSYQVLLYGDFDPPSHDIEFPAIGIRVLSEPVRKSVISSARTVLAARVSVKSRTIDQIVDATRRINILLGAWTLVTWGNSSVGWWSHLSHSTGGGVKTSIEQPDLDAALAGVVALPTMARRKVEAAMFWVREPGRGISEYHRSNLLRKYSAYWNAFECLVDAVTILVPQRKLSKPEKQAALDRCIKERGGRLTPQNIEHCYMTVVNLGFIGKAQHALVVCFGDRAPQYANECFKLSPRSNQLYQIRNAINHGEVDAENPDELLRIEARIGRLFIIVWGMFGRLVPFPYPLDSESGSPLNNKMQPTR